MRQDCSGPATSANAALSSEGASVQQSFHLVIPNRVPLRPFLFVLHYARLYNSIISPTYTHCRTEHFRGPNVAMIEATRRWFRRNRTNLLIGAGVIGAGYVAGQYVLGKIQEARQRMSEERISKEKYEI